MRSLLTVLGATALVATACSAPTPPAGGIEVRPGGISFTRSDRGTVNVPYIVANTGTTAVLLTSRCADRLQLAIERRQGTAWVQYASSACAAIYPMDPVSLAGGGTRASASVIADAGTYRLIVATDRGSVASALFTVR